jgi:quinol monooxygenase YgiN
VISAIKWLLLKFYLKGGRMMNKFGLYGKFTAIEGERDTLVEILLEAAKSMESLDDCEIYTVNISDKEPNSVYVYEVWSNQSAHQASLTLDSTKTLIQQAKPIIAGMEMINMLIPKGGKGIKSSLSSELKK